jgi:hypothetical protein
VPPRIDVLSFRGMIADPAFASDALVADLNARGTKVVIARHPPHAKPLDTDRDLHKRRPLSESCFGKLKEFKRIALRRDKTDQSFAARIHPTAAVINSR